MSEALPCDVCGRTRELHVCCSGFGAMSCGYCAECLSRNAEPSFTFNYLLMTGGPDPVKAFGEQIMDQLSWVDGRYVTFREWCDGKDLAAICKQMDDDLNAHYEEQAAQKAPVDEYDIPSDW